MNIAKKLVTNESLTFSWADETSTTFKFSEFSNDIRERAMQHGFSQKLGDAYSGAGSVAEAKTMLDEVFVALSENDWNRKGGSSGGIWVKAMERASGDTFEEALESWNGLNEDEKKEMKKDVHVKQAKLELDLEAAKKKAAELPAFTLK